MTHLLPIDRLKMKVHKVAELCGGDRSWDKWARRLVMGIDNCLESARRAQKHIDAAFEKKYPTPLVEEFKMDDYPDVGYSGMPSTSYSSSSTPASSYDEEDPPVGPTEKQQKAKFLARIACCKAVIAWGESTMEKPESPARDKLMVEMEDHISSIDSAIEDVTGKTH